MIVVDASVLATAIGDDERDGERARSALRAASEIAAPDLADVEVVSVLRKRWLAGTLDDDRFAAALDALFALPIRRFPVLALMWRAYELRCNVTAYDAAYIALAELLECALLTADERLSRAPGVRCRIEVLSPDA